MIEGFHETKGYENVFELFTSAVMQSNHFKNFKLAIIEAFVAVEILIIQVTEKAKEFRGISKRKISSFKQAVDLAHRMEVELFLFFEFDKSEKSLIGKMNRARTIRNDIMHSNKIAEEKEISELVKLTRNFLFMIIEKYESKFSQTVI